MKIVIACALMASVYGIFGASTMLSNPVLSSPMLPKETIDYINSSQSSWVASSDWVGDMTFYEAKKYAQLIDQPSSFSKKNWGALDDYTAIPDSFDSRNAWPGCVHPILDQGKCGSCWAFAAVESLSDRFCIASKDKEMITLSPQYLVSCDWGSFGCDGGNPDEAWLYMKLTGVPTLTCDPYVSGTTGKSGSCPKTCSDGTEIKRYKSKGEKLYFGHESIQKAIMEGGPVETTFSVYEDFMSYTSGIYKHTTGKYLGGHAVKLIGWGTEESTGDNYWVVANSWGTSWGMQGFFQIYFGDCGIGDQAVAAEPALD